MPGPSASPNVSPAVHRPVNTPAWRLPVRRGVVRDAVRQHGQPEDLLAGVPDSRSPRPAGRSPQPAAAGAASEGERAGGEVQRGGDEARAACRAGRRPGSTAASPAAPGRRRPANSTVGPASGVAQHVVGEVLHAGRASCAMPAAWITKQASSTRNGRFGRGHRSWARSDGSLAVIGAGRRVARCRRRRSTVPTTISPATNSAHPAVAGDAAAGRRRPPSAPSRRRPGWQIARTATRQVISRVRSV